MTAPYDWFDEEDTPRFDPVRISTQTDPEPTPRVDPVETLLWWAIHALLVVLVLGAALMLGASLT